MKEEQASIKASVSHNPRVSDWRLQGEKKVVK